MKKVITLILLLNLFFINQISVLANVANLQNSKYPSYHTIFLNEDKYEQINRKVFNFNLKLNRMLARKIHILWASLVPNFVIDGLNNMYSNIEYPKRLISSLIQKDFEAVKNESKRFLINTTLGLAGLFDVAYKKFNLEMFNEDMEQAFAKCKIKCGNYVVLPFISSTTSRDVLGRIFDFLLNPTTYIATPIVAVVKMGLLVNRTAYIQPMVAMVESNFIDAYDIARKFFGVEKYIKQSNYDRKSVLEKIKDDYDEIDLVDNRQIEDSLEVKGEINDGVNLVVDNYLSDELNADIILENYNPQSPVTDSMRTALFGKTDKKTFWNEISIWNRDFSKKIKSDYIQISPNRDKYKIRYILQKDKNSPLAILFPSVGEGVNNKHNTTLAKIFYDEGYSVLIFGNHFQWEFLKSIEKGHKLGVIKNDVKYIQQMLSNAVEFLSKKYNRTFLNRIALGTSLGAYAVLFLANDQYEIGANNIDKFIAISPPYELLYAIKQMDDIIASWKRYPKDYKEKVALTVAKVMRAYKNSQNLLNLPFSNYEAKLISAFVFHQKLSDLIYAIEKDEQDNIDTKQIYEKIYNTNFSDYITKYILVNYSFDELNDVTSLKSLENYFINKNNYKIYHSLDDYLVNKNHLKQLKRNCDDKMVLFNNGSHLGFLYRKEFIEELKKEIRLKN